MRFDDLIERQDVAAMREGGGGESAALPCPAIRLGRTDIAVMVKDQRVLLIGQPMTKLRAWIVLMPIMGGALFRAGEGRA